MDKQALSTLNLQTHTDDRGVLGVVDFQQIPFIPRRMFWITQTPNSTRRAGHAHFECHQFLICLDGSVRAHTIQRDGSENSFELSLGLGLHLPPMTWLDLVDFSSNACLAVIASHPYDPNDYIHEMEVFAKSVN